MYRACLKLIPHKLFTFGKVGACCCVPAFVFMCTAEERLYTRSTAWPR